MGKPSHEALLPYWDRAAQAEIGIGIPANDPKWLRYLLLEARRIHPKPEYDEVMSFVPEGKDVVFLVRKSAELPDV